MEELEVWQEERIRVTPGEYQVVCLAAKVQTIGVEGQGGWGRIKKIVLWFQIIEGPFMGKIIPAFLAVPNNKVSSGTKFYHFWVVANGLQKPTRNRLKEMGLSKFVNKIYLASIVDVIPKYPDGNPKQEVFHYSRVDYLKELIVGDPKS